MSEIIFHNKPFELRGMKIPEFELRKGEMIRIYAPNFNKENKILGVDFANQLSEIFQKSNPNFVQSKTYRPSRWKEFFHRTTVEDFLTGELGLDEDATNHIVEKLSLQLDWKYTSLGTAHLKTLSILNYFKKNNLILFDFFGTDPEGANEICDLVATELEKGKSAIAFDNLQYADKNEPYESFKPIKLEGGFDGNPLPLFKVKPWKGTL